MKNIRLAGFMLVTALGGCATAGPPKYQIERLREVYREDTARCLCPDGAPASASCLPKQRQDAGDLLFKTALETYDAR